MTTRRRAVSAPTGPASAERESEVVRRARSVGPQRVTVRGRDEVVVVTAEEWRRMSGGDQSGALLLEALQRCPYPDFSLDLESVRSPVRTVDL